MAKAYGISHKCLLPVAGVPMLRRVAEALRASPDVRAIHVSIEDEALIDQAMGGPGHGLRFISAGDSASASALIASAVTGMPLLITTADHALLTPEMVADFIAASDTAQADLTVGLARAETILEAFPDAKRTFLTFGRDRVSGCNLYGLKNLRARKALAFWRQAEAFRKSPFRLMRALGPLLVLFWALKLLNLARAFRLASRRLGITAVPVLMRQATAAVDVDKPADKELAERILSLRD